MFPMNPAPGTLSDNLKDIFVIVAILALIIFAYQSWRDKKRK
jgi:hypothetical protein